MKSHEKKSFLTIFSISFVTLSILASIIAYSFFEENKDYIEENILYKMKEYTFDFKDKNFELEILKKDEPVKFFKIHSNNKFLYSYFEFPKDTNFILKVNYPIDKFNKDLEPLINKTIFRSLLALIFILLFSTIFAYFAIKPMKNAIYLLESFLKDLIHDLNTPVTSILINTKILSKREGRSEEIERIELSAKTISSLYKNLEILSKKSLIKDDRIDIKSLIEDNIEVLKKLYPKIKFIKNLKPLYIRSNKSAVSRIINNILTNACKYNKKNGEVQIITDKNSITIKDTGIGIKNPNKVFSRYYKENERGLGLGMHIVKKLCEELDIEIEINSQINKGTTVKLILN